MVRVQLKDGGQLYPQVQLRKPVSFNVSEAEVCIAEKAVMLSSKSGFAKGYPTIHSAD